MSYLDAKKLMEEKKYTPEEVAERLGVGRQTIYNHFKAGVFPQAYQLPGRRGAIRIPESDLIAFLESSRVKGGELE